MEVAEQSKIRIADIVFAFAGSTSDWVWKHQEAFETFRSQGSPDVVVRLHRVRLPPPTPVADGVRSEGGACSIYLGPEGWSSEFRPRDHQSLPEWAPRQSLVFDRRFASGDLYVCTDSPSEMPALDLRFFLLDLMAAMLPRYDGMMVHASGISDGATGIVFAGHSGVGKSTMAGLWQECDGATVLHDDRIILRKKAEGWSAYPVAGIGEFRAASPDGVPLEAVFLLSQAEENFVKRRAISQAASALLSHISLPAYDAEAVSLGLHLLDDLLHEVPVYELGFFPDETAVDLVREVIA